MQGHREPLARNLSLIHHHFQDADTGRWVAGLELLINGGPFLDVIQGLEPRDHLDFATEAEAVERNHTLAHNWLRTNGFLENNF
jgi:hypothetical protein